MDLTRRNAMIDLVHGLGPAFAERAPGYDRAPAFPFENFADLHAGGLLGLCVPERFGGLGADFATYMHVAATIGSYCPTTALTYNMHSQTVLWTGIVADDLAMSAEERAVLERRRERLYAGILERGELHSQPLSEGIAPGEAAGVGTVATPVAGGWRVSGRKIFASLAGAASAYSITVREPGDDTIRFVSILSSNEGVQVVGEWDALGMRGTDSRTLVFDEAFVPHEDELLPPGVFEQMATRWPHVYLTLTPAYLGLTCAVVDATRAYLSVPNAGGGMSRREVPAKQALWAQIQVAYERSRALWEQAVSEARVDPSAEQVRRAWAASYTVMETAPEVAALAIRACGGISMLRNLRFEQHYRDARCGSLMFPWTADIALERLGRAGLFDA